MTGKKAKSAKAKTKAPKVNEMTLKELQRLYLQEQDKIKSLEDSRASLSATIRESRRIVGQLTRQLPRGARENALCSWLETQVAERHDTPTPSPGDSSASDPTRCDKISEMLSDFLAITK